MDDSYEEEYACIEAYVAKIERELFQHYKKLYHKQNIGIVLGTYMQTELRIGEEVNSRRSSLHVHGAPMKRNSKMNNEKSAKSLGGNCYRKPKDHLSRGFGWYFDEDTRNMTYKHLHALLVKSLNVSKKLTGA
ncbi:hypothetical protein GH714_018537 [Hevea brasiliensis]|uniref:Uncharacterized protein n=1 Tax=Hevea brasiliensis TaxID=3981 RepID=A0A6A6M3L9_HEVBR|nr:hypothetical protein GH714_033071 [Hevea brasiliensis]KAF2313877.1 hypothetical protein GH714_018537 [Hevea brasiliensis]